MLALVSPAATNAAERGPLLQESAATANSPAAAVAKRGCPRLYARADFHRFASRAFRGHGRTTLEQRRTLDRVIRCQRHRKSKRVLRRHRGRYKHALWERREAHRQRLRVTRDWCSPDPHPLGAGCWEIPVSCVFAESGGSWSAHNPTSPARGAYQLNQHGEPWPVDSWQDAMVHHRIAEGLYAARGLQPWVAC